ncbi:unnamed protein product, partial [Symbiodinium sp. KB8]
MLPSVRPVEVLEYSEEDPTLLASAEPQDQRSRQVAKGGILLGLVLGTCACLWLAGGARLLEHPHAVDGSTFNAVGLESVRTSDVTFLDLGKGSVCRGDNVDAHLGPTGKEGKTLSDLNTDDDGKPAPNGVDRETCRAMCAERTGCRGYELGPRVENRCELWMNVTHHEDLFEHNTIYNDIKAVKNHEIHPHLADFHCVLKVSHPSFSHLDQGCESMVRRHTEVLRSRKENFTKTCPQTGTAGARLHPLHCNVTERYEIITKAIQNLSTVCNKELENQAAATTVVKQSSQASGKKAVTVVATTTVKPAVAEPANKTPIWAWIALVVLAILVLGLGVASQDPAVKARLWGTAAQNHPSLLGS